jgi:hypothetical protein
MSSSPISGARRDVPLPVFHISGRGSDGPSADPGVPDRRFTADRRSSAPPLSKTLRAVRLQLPLLQPDDPLLQSLSHSRSVTSLVLGDGGGSNTGSAHATPRGECDGAPCDGGGGGDDDAAASLAQRLAGLLQRPHALARLELDLAHTAPGWAARLPSVLAGLERTLRELVLTLPALSPEGAEAVSEVLAHPECRLTRLALRTTAEPLPGALVATLAEGVRSNTGLEQLCVDNVVGGDAEGAVAALRDAVRTGGARHVPRLVLPGMPSGAGGGGVAGGVGGGCVGPPLLLRLNGAEYAL